jgi:hypothetical protein
MTPAPKRMTTMFFRPICWPALALLVAFIAVRADVTGPPQPVTVARTDAAPVRWWGQASEAAGLPPTGGSAVTQGQLVAVALAAAQEMETKLRVVFNGEGGAGEKIRSQLPAWREQAAAKTPATMAQLRAIQNLFRDRLTAVGYKNFPAAALVPGSAQISVTLAELYRALFFDLDNFDLDGDGKTYAQELEASTSPFDPFNDLEHGITVIEGDNQTGPPGSILPYPLTVRIEGPNGRIWVNTSVLFWVENGDSSWLAATVSGNVAVSPAKRVVVKTDGLGFAGVYLQLGGNTVSATVHALTEGIGDPVVRFQAKAARPALPAEADQPEGK